MLSLDSTRYTVALVWIATAMPSLAAADEIVPWAYRATAAEYGIPVHLFYAVALAESGKTIQSIGLRRPWPWTLNIAGQGVFFATRWQAWQALDASLRSGETSVDIGVMQVNWHFHQHRLGNSWLALEPQHNLTVAANILKDCYRKRHNWWASVGCYHAPSNQKRAERYRARVARHWRTLGAAE